MATDAQINANRRNAQRSTGPKSEAGKKRSSMNATKHGMTSKHLNVMAGDDPVYYQSRIDAFMNDFPNMDSLEVSVCKRLVHVDHILDRVNVCRDYTLSERMRMAKTECQIARCDAAEELGRRLTFEPLDRMDIPKIHDPKIRERMDRREADNPACLKRALEVTAEGCRWMIRRWEGLKGNLRAGQMWHFPEEYDAVRLLGLRPEQVMTEPEVFKIKVACQKIHPDAWSVWEGVLQAQMGAEEKCFYIKQVERFEAGAKFETHEAAYAYLNNIIERELARLRMQENHVAPLAEQAIAEAPMRAAFRYDAEFQKLLRYERDLQLEFPRCVRTFLACRKNREGNNDVFDDDDTSRNTGPNGVSGPQNRPETTPPASGSGSPQTLSRNEPAAQHAALQRIATEYFGAKEAKCDDQHGLMRKADSIAPRHAAHAEKRRRGR